MCNQKYIREERATTFLRLRHFMGKLRNRFSLLVAVLKESGGFEGGEKEEISEVPTNVPGDVKEGHFAVLAMKGSETNRFIINLKYLASPTFLKLLEQAEKEYGFEQTGALVIPCRPDELHEILERHCADV